MGSIVLFTRDLRVHDHPALDAAVSDGDTVVPLFVRDPRLLGRSANRDRFLAECLVDLDRSLTRRGASLVVRDGDPAARVLEVAAETPVEHVHVSADASAIAHRRERELRDALTAHGIELVVHPGVAVVDPGAVAPPGKEMYSVFTPYHRAWAQVPRRVVLPAPRSLRSAEVAPGPRPDPAAVTADSIDLPPGGETAARSHLEAYFADGAGRYAEVRNDLAADATSRLSPYLRFGALSANEVVASAAEVPGAGELVRQIAWRDFYGQLLAHDPALAWTDFREAPDDVPAEPEPEHADYLLERWRMGRTGIPLVDAGMRQLRREGWMHNRARMVVASFLTRRLGVPWQRGAEHFMRWLVDGDPANNAGGWQWVAGTGTDPRRSRSFNPVRQAERFDPMGAYVRRYVRELADVPTPWIFAPWWSDELRASTGYPSPIVEVPSTRPSGPGVAPTRGAEPAHPGQTPLPL